VIKSSQNPERKGVLHQKLRGNPAFFNKKRSRGGGKRKNSDLMGSLLHDGTTGTHQHQQNGRKPDRREKIAFYSHKGLNQGIESTHLGGQANHNSAPGGFLQKLRK